MSLEVKTLPKVSVSWQAQKDKGGQIIHDNSPFAASMESPDKNLSPPVDSQRNAGAGAKAKAGQIINCRCETEILCQSSGHFLNASCIETREVSKYNWNRDVDAVSCRVTCALEVFGSTVTTVATSSTTDARQGVFASHMAYS